MLRAALVVVLVLAAAPPAQAGNRDAFRAPMQLPGQASAASATGTWIVGARPGPRTRAIGRRFGLEPAFGGSAFVAPRGQARQLADALGSRLVWAEPNVPRHRGAQTPGGDPLPTPWRDRVIPDGRAAPQPRADGPLIALVDSPLDIGHPEFATGNVRVERPARPTDLHGTATAAVAAAARNGVGMVGLWPGARAVGIPLPKEPFGCHDSAAGIQRAIRAGAAVINMSYGSSSFCFLEYLQLQRATRRGITLVAAAGNEFTNGNPAQFPGGMPHVLTVAALDRRDRPSYFSTANAAVDLAAPGEGIVTAVPRAFDDFDGRRDGYAAVGGTSFAAPMVAAAAAWVRAERPRLSPDQVAQVVRLGARDLGTAGWQPDSGYGILDVGAALDRSPPPRDPLEPNEDVIWVDGTVGRAAPFISRGADRRLRGLLDRFEDPADVYRVRFPPRSRMRISVTPRFGDPDLRVLARGAPHIGAKRFRVAESRRRGTRRDSVVVRNAARGRRVAYVAVHVPAAARSLDALYRLDVRRLG